MRMPMYWIGEEVLGLNTAIIYVPEMQAWYIISKSKFFIGVLKV